MSANAIISKQCPSGFVYLVPGRIAMNSNVFSLAHPAEEEIVVDAMPANGIGVVTYINPSITLTLLEPDGCEFLPAEENLRPNDIVWDFPMGDSTIIRA